MNLVLELVKAQDSVSQQLMSNIYLVHEQRAAVGDLDAQLKHVLVSPNFCESDAGFHKSTFEAGVTYGVRPLLAGSRTSSQHGSLPSPRKITDSHDRQLATQSGRSTAAFAPPLPYRFNWRLVTTAGFSVRDKTELQGYQDDYNRHLPDKS
jgi:hypothetical protein